MMTVHMKPIAALAALPLLAALGGCAIVKVDATERGNLAKDVMQRDNSLHHAALEQHRYASKETTAGGAGVGGGGCGCN
jgi:hypothetical protein